MSAMIGVLVDVSGSMQRSIGGPVNQQGGAWANSIFRVVDELVKHDESSDDQVFAIGYGAKTAPHLFDVLKTVQKANGRSCNDRDKKQMLENILDILERHGAPYVREWAKADILYNTVLENEAKVFLRVLNYDATFRQYFVQECLPVECKKRFSNAAAGVVESNRKARWLVLGGVALSSLLVGPVALVPTLAVYGSSCVVEKGSETATKESIRKAIDKGLPMLWKASAVEVSCSAIISVHDASNILRDCKDKKEEHLTKKQMDQLMKTVDPFIYGRTPMISALDEAKKLMASPRNEQKRKVLFVLSDGEPTDGIFPPDLSDVDIVCCYVTDSDISDPMHLYSTECADWDNGAKYMFHLSSSIRTQLLPRTIFVRPGWTVDITNNETKLFVQVNHPDMIDDVCKFARDLACSQDALADLLASVDLDLLINKANDGFGANRQEGNTCYANATAAVMYMAMKRIVGREGKYPKYFCLRAQLIAIYGKDGANTLRVLQEVCPLYRLHCKEVDIKGALRAVTAKRPVIAKFRLTDQEWRVFKKLYATNRKGVLTREELDIRKRPAGAELGGHAVVLTSFNSEGLTLMNSWGTDWANNGFFSVRSADVLGLEFVDIYWTLRDLRASEIAAYDREGPRIAAELMEKRLIGLKTVEYTCPLCHQASAVRKFTGQLMRAKCPKCGGMFDTSSHDAHDLVLNMYLVSLR